MIIWDIETGPLSDEALKLMHEPPEPPLHPGEFDSGSVRVGNLKDRAKIDAKIAEAKAAHEQSVASYQSLCQRTVDEAWQLFKGNAALDASTGRVLAIGYHNPDLPATAIDAADKINKEGMIERFWQKAEALRHQSRPMVGLNIHDFDLPFLVRRSWLLGIEVPDWVIRQERYFDSVFVDLRKRWLCGQYAANTRSSFAHLAKAFQTDGKPDGVDGSQFYELWETDREAAIAYLKNDVEQPAKWARAMGIV